MGLDVMLKLSVRCFFQLVSSTETTISILSCQRVNLVVDKEFFLSSLGKAGMRFFSFRLSTHSSALLDDVRTYLIDFSIFRH